MDARYETVTVWFYLLGHGRGQYVATRQDAEHFVRNIIGDECVSYQIAPGDCKGKAPRDCPGMLSYWGSQKDHYE